jgi:outer membrane protein assembly factor BamB
MKLSIYLSIGLFLLFSSYGNDWPHWRGSDRDGLSKETGLLQEWPSGGPNKIWTTSEAGIGYSGFSVSKGRLYTLGAFGKEEHLLAFDAKTGKKTWQISIGELLTNSWGDGPRMTPTVADEKVYALGGKGNLVCVDAQSGRKIWQVHLVQDLGGTVPNWGYTESVLVDQGRVICTPGGEKGTLAALDSKTGKVIWRSREFTDGAQYSSPIVINHEGTRQYVQLVMKNLVGIEADSGRLLWKSPWSGRTAVIPTPIHDDGHVFITTGYGVGCKLVKLGKGKAQDMYENKFMKNHHGGVIKHGDFLYGYSDGYGWVCLDFKKGELQWNEKKALGKGAIAYADNRFYCLSEKDGKIVLIEATPNRWNPRGEFTITPQTKQRSTRGKIWTHPVISNGKLYLRDQELIHCYDVSG